MAEVSGAVDIAKRRVVYELQDAREVDVRQNIPYRATASETLTFDLYRPVGTEHRLLPVVLFVTGFSDVGMRSFVGCNAKDMQSYVSWARLVAGMGLAAVTSTTTTPAEDVGVLLEKLRDEHQTLGIDPNRIGVWACSGNVPNALAFLMDHGESFRCSALCYGFMLDLDGATDVGKASQMFRFVNPCAGRLIEDIPRVPLLVVRAGKDEMPNLNNTIDRFVARGLEVKLPLTVINHAEGPHAFDLLNDTQESRNTIQQILDFLRLHLAET